MIQSNFSANSLHLTVLKDKEGNVKLFISSDYSRSARKSALYVNEEVLARDVESLWKSIRTKKLLALNVSFGEIDYYDNMTDVYQTPEVSIKRGLRKAKVSSSDHGSIPKDWSFDLVAHFSSLKTSGGPDGSYQRSFAW